MQTEVRAEYSCKLFPGVERPTDKQEQSLRPFRILHCIPSLPVGGAERQLALLSSAQAQAGNEVHVAVVHQGPAMSFFDGSPVHWHHLRARENHDPRIALQIALLARRIRPHIIQTWLRQMDVFGGMAARATSVPWVLSERSSRLAYQGRAKDRILRRGIGSFAQAIVANSQGGLEYWERARVRVKCVIPNAVPVSAIRAQIPATDQEVGIENGAKLVLFGGRLIREKNAAALVRASRIICAEENAAVMICGAGPLKTELEMLIAQLGLANRVRLTGVRTDLWALMKRAAVVVNPSFHEGQPNIVLEAVAAGCPLVVSDIPGHREFLDSSSALFFAPTSPDELAAAVLDTLKFEQRSNERRNAASRRIGNLSVENAAAAYSRVYAMLTTGQR
jgi:glycosyltransferase involved in cell wall biosynthesis